MLLLSTALTLAAQPSRPVAPGARPAAPAKAVTTKPPDPTQARRQALQAISAPFFDAVVAGEYPRAMEGLSPVFAISEGKRQHLAERMTELENRLGRASSHELLRERPLPGSSRVVAVYYATYHPLKPAVWEIVYYLAPASGEVAERWMVTSLRFETEQLFEWLEGSTK